VKRSADRVRVVVETAARAASMQTEIRRRANAMLDALQLRDEELSIVLTGDDQIQKLNKNYRGKDRPTDVLAFAQREGEFASLAGGILGDVVISIPTAQKQARAQKRDLLAETTMLLAHGLLHLLGWDHETPAKDKKMRAETNRLVQAAIKDAVKSKSARAANVLSSRAKSERPTRGKH
jgi:probable rRNA maturation factor